MLRPVGYRLLVEVIEIGEKTDGGIYLPEQTRQADEAAQEYGTVVGIGEFCWKEYQRNWCKVGDVVTFQKYAGKVVVDRKTGKKYRAMNDLDIHCVDEPEPNA